MSIMEPSIASEQPAAEPRRTGITEPFFKTAGAPSDRHFEQLILPGLVGSGPIFPEWLRKFFRHVRKDTPASR